MSEVKQYAERDLMAMDIAGNHYCRHVDHMTREKLHSKSDIAAELGWRDMQIAKLTAQRDALAADLESAKRSLTENYLRVTKERNDALYKVIDLNAQMPETPVTDAYLNSVRAEGAMACGIHLREWYDYQVEVRAEEFAAKLRKGESS